MARKGSLVPSKKEKRKSARPVLGFRITKDNYIGRKTSDYFLFDYALNGIYVSDKSNVGNSYDLCQLLVRGTKLVPTYIPKPKKLIVSLIGTEFSSLEKEDIAYQASLYAKAKGMKLELPKGLEVKALNNGVPIRL